MVVDTAVQRDGGCDLSVEAAAAPAPDRTTGRLAAEVIESVNGATLRGFVDDHTTPETTVQTNGATAYPGRENREAVHHSVGEHVPVPDLGSVPADDSF